MGSEFITKSSFFCLATFQSFNLTFLRFGNCFLKDYTFMIAPITANILLGNCKRLLVNESFFAQKIWPRAGILLFESWNFCSKFVTT